MARPSPAWSAFRSSACHGRRRHGGIGRARKITPTGFLPEDDQGAFFVVAQLPGGSRSARTTDVVQRAEAILRKRRRSATSPR